MNDEKLLFIEEEHRNVQHLIRAMSDLAKNFPIDEKFFIKITDEQIDILDLFIFRFIIPSPIHGHITRFLIDASNNSIGFTYGY